MSRFSRAEAEANGWVFVHSSEESVDVLSATQGRFQHNLPLLRAEKYVSLPGRGSTLVNESAESEGKLLEQIALFEGALESKGYVYDKDTGSYSVKGLEPFESQPETTRKITFSDAEDVEGVGSPANTVLVPTDPTDLSANPKVITVSDADFAARDRADVLIVADEDSDTGTKQIVQGGSPEDAATGYEAKLAHEQTVENRRTQEADVGDTKQVVLDPAGVSVDSPGATGTGTIIVRQDEDSPEAVAERRQAEAIEKEQARPEVHSDVEPPEDAPLLAGTDVGIQERGDLGSEIPGAESLHTVEEGYEPATTEGPTAEAAAEEQATREEAITASRDEHLDSDEPETAFEPKAQSEALLEAGEAVQEQADAGDESESEAPADSAQENVEESPEVDATEKAKALADEEGIDLSEVKGTGKEGRVTKPDVEAAIEAPGAANGEPFDQE